jgi:hypothetical protein
MSSRAKIITVFAIMVLMGTGVFALLKQQNQVPQSFVEARSEGAAIAANIVALSNQSAASLQQVNKLDEQGKYTDALTETTDLVAQSQKLRDQAVALSTQIGNMTKALTAVNSFEAQQDALESISSQLALITQLVNYSNDLDKLLITLQNHFTGKTWQANDVVALINQINLDVTAINSFNNQATQAMAQFDKIVGR